MAVWTTPKTWNVGDTLTAADMNAYVRDNSNAASPIGSYLYVAAIAGAAGAANVWQGAWLEANGFAISRTTYAAFDAYLAALSTPRPFGAGDGSTTVNLPDMRGRSAIAMVDSTGNAAVKTIGNNDGIASTNRRGLLHRTSITEPSHVHNITNVSDIPNSGLANAPGDQSTPTSGPVSGGSGTIGITVGSGVAGDPLDGGCYLVGGIWVIKVLA